MTFLTPAFLLGLGAIAIPVVVHLIQRERKRVVQFPSLMFVRKIPYQSVRRRRIRHWFLLLMRAAAVALIVGAFARPFFPAGAAASLAAVGGTREIVVLLDHSASMGYGDHWARAQAAALNAVRSIGQNDKATLVLFERNAEENVRATPDRGRLESAINAAKVTSGSTRYGPALKLAESILSHSTEQRREAVLISDFQKTGWTGSEDVRFTDGITLTPVSVSSAKSTNLSVPSVTFARSTFSGQERITVTAGVSNKSDEPANGVPVSLEMDGRKLETQSINIAPNASASTTFQPFTLADPAMSGVVRAGADQLPADNAYYFVVTPSQDVSVLVVNNGDRAESSFYLSRALAIGNTPSFKVEVVPAARVSSSMLDKKTVVVLNDAPLPPALAGGVLKRFVERGGGLLVAFGEHTVWPGTDNDLLPGKVGAVVDRVSGHGGTIGYRDYSHPVWEVFKAPRSGDFSAARVLRYRAIETAPDARVLARYDDGAAAAVEKRVGSGRVIAWTTSLDDSWNDFVVRPVYLPLVQQLAKYLAQYEQPTAWMNVGQVVDLSTLLKGKADRVVVTPASERTTMRANDPALLELNEQGVYEIRTSGNNSGRPDRIAVNLDPTESDLTPLDATELVAAVTGLARPGATASPQAPAQLSAADAEKRQGVWWYLLLAGLLLLASETAVANYLSRNERFT
jgi:hypothetical protein